MNELRRKGLSLLEQKLITANGFPYTREVQKPFDITGANNGHMQKQSGFSLYLRTAEQWNGFLRSSFLKNRKNILRYEFMLTVICSLHGGILSQSTYKY